MSDVSEIYKVILNLNAFGELNGFQSYACVCPKHSGNIPESLDKIICIRDLCDDCGLEYRAKFFILPDLEMFLCTVNPELERITLALIGHTLDVEYLEEQ
jgi:hypothetical protein